MVDDASVVEHALIERARMGDARAFDSLMRPHREKLWGICVRVTLSRADAEDAVQECMIAIWRGLPRFRGESAFATWTYRIAANAALGVVRRRRDVPVAEMYDMEEDGLPFDEVIAIRDEVRAALLTVPEDFRVALVLREYGGLTYEEISEHQGIPVQTVKSRLHRARAAVRSAPRVS